nr:hypothetical protein BaRGS_000864 [Batillaria attramentaria]
MAPLLFVVLIVGAGFAVLQSPADVTLDERVDKLEKLMLQQTSLLEAEKRHRQAVEAALETTETRLRAENSRQRAEWEKERHDFRDIIAHLRDKLRDKTTEHTKDVSSTVHGIGTRSDDLSPLEPVITQLSQKLTEVSADVQALKNTNTQQDAAIQEAATSVYVRWGRSVCPTSTQLVYSGVVGGSHDDDLNANYLCLSMSPVLSDHSIPGDWVARLYGAEYETHDDATQDKDPVCAVCRSRRPTTVMVPGTNACPPGWTVEYHGFLMSDRHGRTNSASEFICVDSQLESRPGTNADLNGRVLFFTVTVCGSLPCDPYVNNKVVTCAVCSK